MSLLTRALAQFSPGGTPADPLPYDTSDPYHSEPVYAPAAVEEACGPQSFADLGIAPDLVAALESQGISVPFPVQAMTIPDALAGRDVCGKAKTGSGKTLAFGLPLVERTSEARRRRPRSLVLVPTRELANQIADALTPLAAARQLWLTAIYGGVSMQRQIQALHAGVDLVIATPGRLNDLLEREELSLADVEFVVLDEADQMADMGFLPQVERILRQIETKPQMLLFSATLDGAVGELVRRYQHQPVRHEVLSNEVSVETLTQRFIGVTAEEKVAVTGQICAGARRALAFVRTTHGADRLVKHLEREGLRAGALHGRLSQQKRDRTLAAFVDGSVPVLVATNVAARGLHVDAIDVVVHYDPPEDAKTYLHRSGRTARAGESGLVVTLVQPEQLAEITRLERDAGLDYEVVPMGSGDARLLDLASFDAPRGLPTISAARSSAPVRRGGRTARDPRRKVAPEAGSHNDVRRTPASRDRRPNSRAGNSSAEGRRSRGA